ncbi:MAG: hypothetical protein NUV77_06415, partial [Thermoguttaceae bacterium]|nr:hypothetical protein [Thermoguttaceae bacterium]
MSNNDRITFGQIVEKTRLDAAKAAWSRAKLASRLRHHVRTTKAHHAARQLSKLKTDAIRLALALAPEQITVTIDNDHQVGLISVRWPG